MTAVSKGSFRTALIIVLGSLLAVAIVAGVLITRALAYPGDRHRGTGKEVELEIRSGMSFPAIAAMLSERGLVDKSGAYYTLGDERMGQGRERAGEWLKANPAALDALVAKLVAPPAEPQPEPVRAAG